jgi:hypothetical protein
MHCSAVSNQPDSQNQESIPEYSAGTWSESKQFRQYANYFFCTLAQAVCLIESGSLPCAVLLREIAVSLQETTNAQAPGAHFHFSLFRDRSCVTTASSRKIEVRCSKADGPSPSQCRDTLARHHSHRRGGRSPGSGRVWQISYQQQSC